MTLEPNIDGKYYVNGKMADTLEEAEAIVDEDIRILKEGIEEYGNPFLYILKKVTSVHGG